MGRVCWRALMISGLLQGKTYTSSTIMSGRNEIRQGQEMVAGTWSITYLCVLRAAKRKSKGHHQAESFHSPHVSGSLVFVPPRVLLPRTGYPRERVEPCELVPLPRLWGGGSTLCQIPVTLMASQTAPLPQEEMVQEGSCWVCLAREMGLCPPERTFLAVIPSVT